MSEFGGSEKGEKQGLIARSTEELARSGVRSPEGNSVVGHDELTPSEMRGVIVRGGNSTADLGRDLVPEIITDPVSGRSAESSKAS